MLNFWSTFSESAAGSGPRAAPSSLLCSSEKFQARRCLLVGEHISHLGSGSMRLTLVDSSFTSRRSEYNAPTRVMYQFLVRVLICGKHGQPQLCSYFTGLFSFKLLECKHHRKHQMFFVFCTFFKEVRSLRLTKPCLFFCTCLSRKPSSARWLSEKSSSKWVLIFKHSTSPSQSSSLWKRSWSNLWQTIHNQQATSRETFHFVSFRFPYLIRSLMVCRKDCDSRAINCCLCYFLGNERQL